MHAFEVDWVQASPDAAESATYTLWRYPTGATEDDKTPVCTTVDVSANLMDSVNELGTSQIDSVTYANLQLKGVPLCDVDPDSEGLQPLAKGRWGPPN